ncbi:MAG: hypothetical protein II857_02295 [Selenomonadaceae bacterium]|nr:hypothetical protein [Selenomonadaceae bacterium]
MAKKIIFWRARDFWTGFSWRRSLLESAGNLAQDAADTMFDYGTKKFTRQTATISAARLPINL